MAENYVAYVAYVAHVADAGWDFRHEHTMSIFTEAELEQLIADWKRALTQASKGQKVVIGETEIVRPSDEMIWKTLDRLAGMKKALAGQAGPAVRPHLPRRSW